MEVMERLVALIPPLKANQVLYQGVLALQEHFFLAPRWNIVARLPMVKQKKLSNPETLRLTKKERGENSRWVLWADLMKRVFAENVCVCRNCGLCFTTALPIAMNSVDDFCKLRTLGIAQLHTFGVGAPEGSAPTWGLNDP